MILNHGSLQPMVRFINFLLALTHHELLFWFVCKAKFFPTWHLEERWIFILIISSMNCFYHFVINIMRIATFVSFFYFLWHSFASFFIDKMVDLVKLCPPLQLWKPWFKLKHSMTFEVCLRSECWPKRHHIVLLLTFLLSLIQIGLKRVSPFN